MPTELPMMFLILNSKNYLKRLPTAPKSSNSESKSKKTMLPFVPKLRSLTMSVMLLTPSSQKKKRLRMMPLLNLKRSALLRKELSQMVLVLRD